MSLSENSKIHRKISNKWYLNQLLQLYNNRCYWCGIKIIRLRNVIVLVNTEFTLIYLHEDKEYFSAIATLDHIIPVSVDIEKAFDIYNMVPACRKCNHDRDMGQIKPVRDDVKNVKVIKKLHSNSNINTSLQDQLNNMRKDYYD